MSIFHKVLKLAVPLTVALSAEAGGGEEFGFHVANEPLDDSGEQFRTSVRHCRALERVVYAMRERHGWLISLETPPVVYTADLQPVVQLSTGEVAYQCMRPVEFAVNYSGLDPLLAVQTVLESYNAASPPFTARVEWCGGNLCVVADQIKSAEGTAVSVVHVMDTPVTVIGTTRRELLQQAVQQVSQATGSTITLSLPDSLAHQFDAPADVSPSPGSTARSVFAQVVGGFNQESFEKAWNRRHATLERDRVNFTIADIHGEFVGYAYRQGMSEEEADVEWSARRAQLEEQLAGPVAPPAPHFVAGLGPGWAWDIGVGYGSAGPVDTAISLRSVLAPGDVSYDFPLPSTGPMPGADTDGDGRADAVDMCPDSPPGEPVLRSGCTVSQVCPCDEDWPTNGEYRICIQRAVRELVEIRALPKNQLGSYQKSVYDKVCAH